MTQRYPSTWRAIGDAVAFTVQKTGLVPVTTVTQRPAASAGVGALAGDLTVSVAALLTSETYPRPRLNPGGTLSWWDGTDEEDLNIAAVSPDGLTLTLDFAGKPYTGLQFNHPLGSRCGTNCYGYVPWELPAMLKTDDCVFFAAPMNKGTPIGVTQGGFPLFGVHLQYHRQLFRKAGIDGSGNPLKLDMNVWAGDELHRMWHELETFEQAILQNGLLRTDYTTPAVQQLGRKGAGGDVLTFNLDKIQMDADTWHYFAEATLLVTGHRQTIITS